MSASAACGADSGTGSTAINSVVISGATRSIQPGQTLQLTASAFTASGVQVVAPGTFAWSSTVASVASVDQTGKASGIVVGQTSIIATVGGVAGTYALSVATNTPSARSAPR